MSFKELILISIFEKKLIIKEKQIRQLLKDCGSAFFIQTIKMFNWIINLYFPLLIVILLLFFCFFIYDIGGGLELIIKLEGLIPNDFCRSSVIQSIVPLICAASELILGFLDNKLYNFKNENIIIWYLGTVKLYLLRVMPSILFVCSLFSDNYKFIKFLTLVMSVVLFFINIHLSAVMSIKRLCYAMFEQVLEKEINAYSKLNKDLIKVDNTFLIPRSNESLMKIKEIFKNTSDNNLKNGTFNLMFSTPEVALFKSSFYYMEKTNYGYLRRYNGYKNWFVLYILFKLIILFIVGYVFILPSIYYVIIIFLFMIELYKYEYSVFSLLREKKVIFKENQMKMREETEETEETENREESQKKYLMLSNNLLQNELFLMIKKNGYSSVFVSDLMILLKLLEDDFYSVVKKQCEEDYNVHYKLHRLSLYYTICYTYVKEILDAENQNKRQQRYRDFYLFIKEINSIFVDDCEVCETLKIMIQFNLIYLMAIDDTGEFDNYFFSSDKKIHRILCAEMVTLKTWFRNEALLFIQYLKEFGSKDLFDDEVVKYLNKLLEYVSEVKPNDMFNLLELKKGIQDVFNNDMLGG